MTILLKFTFSLAVRICMGWFVFWEVVNLYEGVDSVALAIFLNFLLMTWIVIVFGSLDIDLEYSYFQS